MFDDQLEERVARVLCISQGVDPEKECFGLGNLKPIGWVGPAWQVRLDSARVAIAEITKDKF